MTDLWLFEILAYEEEVEVELRSKLRSDIDLEGLDLLPLKSMAS